VTEGLSVVKHFAVSACSFLFAEVFPGRRCSNFLFSHPLPLSLPEEAVASALFHLAS